MTPHIYLAIIWTLTLILSFNLGQLFNEFENVKELKKIENYLREFIKKKEEL